MPVEKETEPTNVAGGASVRMLKLNLHLRQKLAEMEGDSLLLSERMDEFKRNPPEQKGKKHLSSKPLQELESRAHEAESQVETLLTEKEELITELEQIKKELAQSEERVTQLTEERTALRFQLEEKLQNMSEE